MDSKWKGVDVTYNGKTRGVRLDGVMREEKLTPKLAARAARVAFGHRNGVTVWDNERRHGYRLYANSARKLSQS
jgi:hypothetical protein